MTGERVNSVCMEAEALLTRLWLIADDYHIFPAKPDEVLIKAAIRRMANKTLCMERVVEMLNELEKVSLIARYEVDGEQLGAFLQAPPLTHANGKGPRKGFPHPPTDRFAWDEYNRHWKTLGGGESKQSKESRDSKESKQSKKFQAQHNISKHKK
ncbi:hypothetical protein KS4_23770 [Poriferisphaera corsica]|uniref:Uncharacterized protein n=1 Tax=Poriferisphaera corsica TaxID=2528020 RepID=A0A517YVR7_9BACT|nr:hypothetical protein [Poriferisphaera corsica]QDU34310.1 hypothetical protein KS4_23770 [Poriferisphaera corsica]